MQEGIRRYRHEAPETAYKYVLEQSRMASNFPEAIAISESRGLFYLKALEYFTHLGQGPEAAKTNVLGMLGLSLPNLGDPEIEGQSVPTPGLASGAQLREFTVEEYYAAGESFLRRGGLKDQPELMRVKDLVHAKLCFERAILVDDFMGPTVRHLRRLKSDRERLSEAGVNAYKDLAMQARSNANYDAVLGELVEAELEIVSQAHSENSESHARD